MVKTTETETWQPEVMLLCLQCHFSTSLFSPAEGVEWASVVIGYVAQQATWPNYLAFFHFVFTATMLVKVGGEAVTGLRIWTQAFPLFFQQANLNLGITLALPCSCCHFPQMLGKSSVIKIIVKLANPPHSSWWTNVSQFKQSKRWGPSGVTRMLQELRYAYEPQNMLQDPVLYAEVPRQTCQS